MSYLISGSKFLLHRVRRDPMAIGAMLMPFIFGLLIRFGVPLLEQMTSRSFSSLYTALDMILAMLAPTLTSIAFATVMLEEVDDRIATFYCVTPFGKRGYLLTRIGLPILVSSMMNVIILTLFSLSERPWSLTLALIGMGALQAVIISLIVVAMSSNKVEGMTVARLATTTLVSMFFPFFISNWTQYLVLMLPAFWLGKALQSGQSIYVLVSVLESMIWIWLLSRIMIRKLEK